MKQNNSNDILYFSLKLKSDEFKSLHPELTVEECDIPKMPSTAKTEMKKIGFAISA